MVFSLGEEVVFPNPENADESGLIACGGDLRPERLLSAYAQGIFPWPHGEQERLLWFSPNPRTVLLPDHVRLSLNLKRLMKKHTFVLRMDSAFSQVITSCASVKRKEEAGTWITRDMIEAYCHLHQLGYAHSIECWKNGALAGGLYGVSLGAAFFGESMFTREDNASKVALIALLQYLGKWGFHFVDCQMTSPLVRRLGAIEWERPVFMSRLKNALRSPSRVGKWMS